MEKIFLFSFYCMNIERRSSDVCEKNNFFGLDGRDRVRCINRQRNRQSFGSILSIQNFVKKTENGT